MAWNDDPRIGRILDAALAWMDGMAKAQQQNEERIARSLAIQAVTQEPPVRQRYLPVRIHSFWSTPSGELVAMLEDGRTFLLPQSATEWRELPRLPVEVREADAAPFAIPFHA